MSKSEYDRAWGTAGWLDDHEFMGDGRTVKCQRKTKAYDLVGASLKSFDGFARVKAVYRKVFTEGDELCAAFLYGTTEKDWAGAALELLGAVAGDLHGRYGVEFAAVTTYLHDIPSGYWRAIVVFKRRAAK